MLCDVMSFHFVQYYSVLQKTTPVLPSITPYYEVLLCTTKYYSTTAPYYKELPQYYNVPQSNIPVLQSHFSTLSTSRKHPCSTFPSNIDTELRHRGFQTSLNLSASCHATSVFPSADNYSKGLCRSSGGYPMCFC